MKKFKKIQNLSILLLFFKITLFGQVYQTYPNITVNSKTESVVTVTNQLNAYMEIPPWVKPGGCRSYYFTTHFTKVFSTPISLADDNLITLDLSNSYGPTIVSTPLIWWNGYRQPTSNTDLQWRRNYQGIFSTHSFNNLYKGEIVVAYSHGENKNEIVPGFQYQNTVWPNFVIDSNNTSTYSGYVNGTYSDGLPGYFAFVNTQWIENTPATNWAST